jgi:hypothetical protein
MRLPTRRIVGWAVCLLLATIALLVPSLAGASETGSSYKYDPVATSTTTPANVAGGAVRGNDPASGSAGTIGGPGRLLVATEEGPSAIEQATSKVPDEWGPGQPARSGGGWRRSDPAEKPGTNYIRVDPGNPDSSDPLQQVDHVHVSSGGAQVANHLPLDQWLLWGSWNAP